MIMLDFLHLDLFFFIRFWVCLNFLFFFARYDTMLHAND